MRLGILVALLAAAALLGGCGGSSGNGGGGTCNPGTTAAITIKSTGLSPVNVCVLPTGTVTFTNTDTKTHDLVSDASCPELNTGSLAASGGSIGIVFPTAKVCSFHDSGNPADTQFQGSVNVTTAPISGPGY